ncbi:MSC_0623 family F1-like ATPase-associated protein [Mesomycoplasma lagogenitalium]|uniref:DUF2714 domain-containing protein n=1 Tax=Mesomycoplasma lagogenitalium TaxID=171286 RepID=A0ABY8LXY9_9BACT|nr:DUF2714 domain-containing protein [Mesomycoplasma lagogenitalium]WGI37002.1 DUF2714 domain-containing protein [Mesomycoplasma lagogenitalium]
MKKFKWFLSKKKKEENSLMFPFFDLYKRYEDVRNSNLFIKYDKFMATVLLKSSLGFKSQEILEYAKEFEQALKKKEEIIFQNFVISYNVDPKYGHKFLVPITTDKISSNNQSVNFNKKTVFYEKLNFQIQELLNKNCYIELFPGLIIYNFQDFKLPKLLFSKSNISQIN